MPVASILHLIVENEIDMSRLTGNALHGVFFNILSQADPNLHDRLLKDHNTLRPFTLGILGYRNNRRLRRGQEFRLRFTFLDDSLFFQFTQGSMKELKQVNIKGAKFSPVTIQYGSSQNNYWAGRKTWKEIFDSAKIEREISLLFATPTTFKRGDIDSPVPLPNLVYHGLFQKWQQFSGIPLNESLPKFIEENVGLSSNQIEFTEFRDGRKNIQGFTGKCTFKIKEELDEEILKQINILADFSFFAGTGRKTTHGMGMTRRIRE